MIPSSAECVGGNAQSVEDADLDRLDLSVRALNCIHNAGLKKVGQLAVLTAADILRWQNAGVKTLREIRSVLGSLGLFLSGDMGPVGLINPTLLLELSAEPPPVRSANASAIYLKDAAPEMQRRLITRLKAFNMSVRAMNVIVQNKIVYLGELAQLDENDLMRFDNIGRHTIKELSDLTESFGLSLGTSIPDWSKTEAASLEEVFAAALIEDAKERSDKLIACIGAKPVCLEDELDRIARTIANDRDAEIVKKLWGWNGQDPRTLESVGTEIGLTRERVRQLEFKALKRFQDQHYNVPYLLSAIEFLRKCCPDEAGNLGKRLCEAGISKKQFSVWSVIAAAKTFKLSQPFERIQIDRKQIIVGANYSHKLAKIMPALRRKTSDAGCTSIFSLASEVKMDERQLRLIVEFLELAPHAEWLDEEKEWVFARGAARNRLFNLISKVFSVCPQIRVSELRRAVSRSRRLPMAPPQKILSAFVERSGLGRIEGDVVVANANLAVAPTEGSLEGRMLRVLDEFGPVMDGEEYAERCVEAGINATTFYVYRLMSPVICALGKGVYCKVGSDVAPGTIEGIVSRRRSVTRSSDYGWTQKGSLWFGIELTRQVMTAGSIRLAQFVSDFVQGEWHVTLPDGTGCGHVTCRDLFIWSFRKSFALLGAEPGDLAAFEFDLKNKNVLVKVGGPGLFEAIQEPESEMLSEMADDDA